LSFADWVNNGWLVAHRSSRQEIDNLLRIVARDLKDGQAKDVSDDWRPPDIARPGRAITVALFSRSN
jgi:hypothetical protein